MTDRGPSRTARGPSREERRAERAATTDDDVVMAAAARFLEARPRSVAEVRRRLHRQGYPDPLVLVAVDRLVDLGLLDDVAFARSWLESRDRAHPRGERALRTELLEKGVGRTVVDEVLADRRSTAGDETADGESDLPDEAAAERLVARRAVSLGRVADPRVRRARTYALLARNGFSPSVCARVAARFANGDAPGEDPDDAV